MEGSDNHMTNRFCLHFRGVYRGFRTIHVKQQHFLHFREDRNAFSEKAQQVRGHLRLERDFTEKK